MLPASVTVCNHTVVHKNSVHRPSSSETIVSSLLNLFGFVPTPPFSTAALTCCGKQEHNKGTQQAAAFKGPGILSAPPDVSEATSCRYTPVAKT